MGEMTTPGCFDGSSGGSGAAAAGCATAQARRDATGARRHAAARDAHALAVLFDLDFGEARLVEQLASVRGSDSRLTTGAFGVFCHDARLVIFDFAPIMAARPRDRERIALDAEAADHGPCAALET